jgi:hypothetical protein
MALKLFRDESAYVIDGVGDQKILRSNLLLDAFNQLLNTVLLSKSEIDALPDTDVLGINGDIVALGFTNRKYMRWNGLPTIHERAHLFTIYNEIYVMYADKDAGMFSEQAIRRYVAKNSKPESGNYLFVLLDRIIVLDKAQKEHRTKVTSLVRTARFGKDDKRPWGNEFGKFNLHYLRRRALAKEWESAVERASDKEPSAALLDIPNVPGFMKPFNQVPLTLSCAHCHAGRIILFNIHRPDNSKPPVESLYINSKPPSSQ